jgi:hypothetical protein
MGAVMSDTSALRIVRPIEAVDLAWWAAYDWTGGIELDALAGLERFSVCTRNSTYDITVLSTRTGDILVQGGRFFPVRTRARLAGCSLGGGALKVRAIHPGFLMEFLHEGRTIVTTTVRFINPVESPAPQ